MGDPHLLEAEGIVKHFGRAKTTFGRPGHVTKAVDGVSLHLDAGETLAVVGESGSGKSTLARCLVGAAHATAGEVRYGGQVVDFAARSLPLSLRREMQMVFQDPTSSLDPRMKVRRVLEQGIELHRLRSGRAVTERVEELLDLVGLGTDYVDALPHELSGGQRQRVAIARALSVEPRVVVCDEAVSALDVSIQAQILNLLMDLQAETGVSYLFITHDLGVVRQIADRVLVMYGGKMVETRDNEDLFERPREEYTRRLLASVPQVTARVASSSQRSGG